MSEIFDGEQESIPQLFAPEDAARFAVAEASFDEAACLSYRLASDAAVSEATKDNFRRVLDYISLGLKM